MLHTVGDSCCNFCRRHESGSCNFIHCCRRRWASCQNGRISHPPNSKQRKNIAFVIVIENVAGSSFNRRNLITFLKAGYDSKFTVYFRTCNQIWQNAMFTEFPYSICTLASYDIILVTLCNAMYPLPVYLKLYKYKNITMYIPIHNSNVEMKWWLNDSCHWKFDLLNSTQKNFTIRM